MDHLDLFRNCRNGNLDRVKYLVEQKDIELNIRDKWDSTPLYYACLCGHSEVVKYLLQNGAKCEANSFDGERCLYGALSQEIRNMLKNYHVITAQGMRRGLFDEFLRTCYEDKLYVDVNFMVHNAHYSSHSCILCARSEYFRDRLLYKWRDKKHVPITNTLITTTAFEAILEYLYTGRINKIAIEDVDDVEMLAINYKLPELSNRIRETVAKAGFFSRTKAGTRINQISIDPPVDSIDLDGDLSVLAEQAIPVQLRSWVTCSELPFFPGEETLFADVCLRVEGHVFMCHRTFLCLRSDYFKALLEDNFRECMSSGDMENEVPVITLHDIRVDVFVHVVYYIYTDLARLTEETVFDVLYAADLYLLPGLKRQCAAFIGQYLEVDNVVRVLQTARLFDLPRLEDQCTAFLAKHLHKCVEDEEFHSIICQDAERVACRQETDSIPVVDDIRYHIASNVQTYSGMQDAGEYLTLLDQLLDRLGLDA